MGDTRVLDPFTEQHQRCVQLELVEAVKVELDGGEDESINEVGSEIAQDRDFMFARTSSLDNHDRISTAPRLFLDEVREFPEVGPCEVGNCQCQGVGLSLAKALRSNIRSVTQLTDCVLNCLPSSGGDMGEIIYYV